MDASGFMLGICTTLIVLVILANTIPMPEC